MPDCKNKAPGPDDIPADLFLANITLWLPVLTNILGCFAAQGPQDSWRSVIIVPIYKKGDRSDPKCYRPISLIDSSCKIMGQIILERLEDWMAENGKFSNIQYGFRKGLGTVEQCLNLHLVIGKYTMVKPGTLYLVFMDLTSDFDWVQRGRLWEKMLLMGIDPTIVNFLAAMHQGVTGRVRYGAAGELASPIKMDCGVRQGCVLAPFLFCLYINDLESNIRIGNTDAPIVGKRSLPALLYADDCVLMSRTGVGLQRLLTGFNDFMSDLGLKTNVAKSHVMVTGESQKKKYFLYK